MRNTIIDAIKNRQMLSFTYSGLPRIVEPHAVGRSKTGKDLLSCFQTQGSHVTPGHEWDLCEISKMFKLSTTGQNFTGPRPGYVHGDSRLAIIYAQL